MAVGKFLAITGIVLTVVYAVFTWWLIGDRFPTLRVMDLNEVGDFLAGAFGPLAILWLVLGFFQQGIELRQGTDALRLQAKELNNSVAQQCEMVAAQKASLKNYERSLEPLFGMVVCGADWFEGEFFIDLLIKNTGEYCELISVKTFTDSHSGNPIDLDPLMNGVSTIVRIGELLEWEDCKVVIGYKTRSGLSNSQSFTAKHYRDESGDHYSVQKHPFLS
jgi:hypothetical protein